ncbi:MAG: FapA family protein [Eubacteriales bacterium]
MNGYFQILIAGGKTEIVLHPPKDGGELIDTRQIVTYLTELTIDYNLQEVTQGVLQCASLNKEVTKTLMNVEVPHIKEKGFVQISPDRMEAHMQLMSPSNEGARLSLEDVVEILESYGVCEQSIDHELVASMLEERDYGNLYTVANGKEAVHGEEGSIEYCFNVDAKPRPTLNEDGTVDFFNLNALNDCKQGEVLAIMTPETNGESGYNVLGGDLAPRIPKKMVLKFGRNIELSEDGLNLISQVDGHVSLVDDRVFVSNLYTVEDVDTTTGNITYEGNVLVNGNVRTGFSVIAKGNVEVRGIVEGATIQADGDIIIARGMNGRGTGTLNAGGNIIAKYFENAIVNAKGFIETEAAMHCELSSATEINVVGRRGYIIGGHTSAFSAVHAKNIGAQMGGKTIIQVGFQPKRVARMEELIVEMQDIKQQYDRIAPTLQAIRNKICHGEKLQQAQLDQFKLLADDIKLKQEVYLEAEKEVATIKTEMSAENRSIVTVESTVYQETTILMGNATYAVSHAIKNCKFVKVGAEIEMQSL